MSLSRREFLKRGAALGAVGGIGGVSGYRRIAYNEYYSDFPHVPENHVQLPPNGKSVLILGGGLAGLQAACELVDRGFRVTVLEKTALPGGKLKAWKDHNFARQHSPNGYTREHGLHGVWHFYKNLREFLGRHQVPLNKLSGDRSFYYFVANYGQAGMLQNKMPAATWPMPFDRLQMLFQPGLDIRQAGDLHQKASRWNMARASSKLWGFDFANMEERLYMDSLTFYDWAKQLNVPEEYINHFFDGLADMGYFMNTRECSALAVANFVRMGASPSDSRVDYYAWPPDETFLQPMVRHIIERGGQVIFNTEVTSLKIDRDRVLSVSTNQNFPAGRVRRCRVCGNIITGSGHHDHCPFCGAHHDMLEEVGPELRRVGRYEADYFITAMDVPGARRIASRPELFERHDYFRQILGLTTATILCVNLLYENSDAWERRFPDRDFWNAIDFFPTGFRILGFTSNWSFRQIPGLRDKKVDLIEVQVANWQQFTRNSFEEIAGAVHRELKKIVPALPEPSEFYINRWDNYTGARPGDEARRPEIQSPIDNLLFIGDWVSVPEISVFMERTNVTAKTATNILLEKIGQSEGRIRILKSGTPDLITDALGLFTTVRP